MPARTLCSILIVPTTSKVKTGNGAAIGADPPPGVSGRARILGVARR